MKKFILVLAATCGLIIGCKSNKSVGGAELTVSITPSKDTLTLSSLFKNYKVIELDSVMTNVIDVQPVDSMLLVLGEYEGKDLHLFTYNGKFVRSLVSYGQAGNEVLNVQAVRYNKYKKTIDVLSNYGANIYQYGIDGNLVNKLTMPESTIAYAKDFNPININEYLVYKDLGYLDSTEYKLYVYNAENNSVKAKFMELDKAAAEIVSIGQRHNVFEFEDDILFYDVTANGVYRLEADSLSQYISFEKNKYTLPDNIIEQSSDLMSYIDNCRKSNCIWAHRDVLGYNNMLFSVYSFKENEIYLNVIDINANKANSYAYINDDLISKKVSPVNNLNIINSIGDYLVVDLLDGSAGNINKTNIVLLAK